MRFEKAAKWAQDHPRGVGAELRRRSRSRSQGRRGVAGRAACVCRPNSTTTVVASEQKIADLFAESGQIPSAPKFADWVDRRYNDALRTAAGQHQLGGSSMSAQVLLVPAHQR